MRRFATLVLLAAMAAPLASAQAQCRLCDAPTTARDDGPASSQVRLEVETSVDFDRLVLVGEGEGTAVLRPDGSRSASGSLAEVGPRAMVGTVVLRGEPGRSVRVDMPQRISLYSLGGGEISFDEVVTDLPPLPRLDPAGTLTFRFGGRLTVRGDSEGDFRGDLPILAEYL